LCRSSRRCVKRISLSLPPMPTLFNSDHRNRREAELVAALC